MIDINHLHQLRTDSEEYYVNVNNMGSDDDSLRV